MTAEGRMALYQLELEALASRALADGIVLTLKEYPLPPLAMGNYGLRAEARLANDVYRGRREVGRPRNWRCQVCKHHFCVCDDTDRVRAEGRADAVGGL